jgi:hypothetical protein
MDRAQAVEALELLRRHVGQARDDTTLQNWGVIWMLHGLTNGLGFVGTNILMWRGYETPWPYVMLWGVILPVNMSSIFLLKSRPAGAWTFFESMIWLIWTTFIGAALLATAANYFLGFSLVHLGPVVAVLSAYAFAMMGGMGKRWFLGSGVRGGGGGQARSWMGFIILGTAWGSSSSPWRHAERAAQRRLATGQARLDDHMDSVRLAILGAWPPPRRHGTDVLRAFRGRCGFRRGVARALGAGFVGARVRARDLAGADAVRDPGPARPARGDRARARPLAAAARAGAVSFGAVADRGPDLLDRRLVAQLSSGSRRPGPAAARSSSPRSTRATAGCRS